MSLCCKLEAPLLEAPLSLENWAIHKIMSARQMAELLD